MESFLARLFRAAKSRPRRAEELPTAGQKWRLDCLSVKELASNLELLATAGGVANFIGTFAL